MEKIKFEEPNPEKEKDWFEKQWAHPEHLKVFGSNEKGLTSEFFDVYDIKPEGEIKTIEPILIGMGWGAIPESDKKRIKYLAEHGNRIIVSATPHGISAEGKEGYKNVEMEKMSGLVETARAKGIEVKEDGTSSGKVRLWGRSEGAIFSIFTAYFYPELVKDLVLENPAGLTGKINLGIFFKRWLDVQIQQRWDKYKEKGVNPGDHMPEVFGRNPAKMMESVLAIATADIKDILKEIRAHGIGVAVIANTDDKFFPIDKLAGTVVPEPLSITSKVKEIIPGLTTEDVDGFYVWDGTHDSAFYQPEKSAAVVDQAFDALEAKRQKELEIKNRKQANVKDSNDN